MSEGSKDGNYLDIFTASGNVNGIEDTHDTRLSEIHYGLILHKQLKITYGVNDFGTRMVKALSAKDGKNDIVFEFRNKCKRKSFKVLRVIYFSWNSWI